MKIRYIAFLFLAFAMKTASGQNVSIIYTPTCYGDQTTMQGHSVYPDSDIQSWLWDIDNDGTFDFSGKTIMYFFTSSGSHSVKLKIVPTLAPADSVVTPLIVDPLPNVNFHVDNVCEYQQATFTAQASIASGSIAQYLWDYNNDGVIDDNSGQITHYNCGQAQTFLSRLTCVSDKGCSAFTTKTTEVFPRPVPIFTVSNPPYCAGDNIEIINTSVVPDIAYYLWNFGDGNQEILPGNVNYTYANSGGYSIQLTAVSQHSCSFSYTYPSQLQVNPKPLVTVTTPDTLFSSFSGCQLSANGADSYLWSTGNSNQNIQVIQTGTYTVTGTTNGCTNTASIHVTKMDGNNTIRLQSTILTPNGDGINDNLVIEHIGNVGDCSLEVYNIYNEKVFSSQGYQNNWGCTYQGGSGSSVLPDGAYYYYIQVGTETVKGCFNIITKK